MPVNRGTPFRVPDPALYLGGAEGRPVDMSFNDRMEELFAEYDVSATA